VYRSRVRHSRVELDLAKRVFVSRDIVLQNGQQGFGLLGAQIDTLKILDFDLGFALLMQSAKNQEKVPDIYPHLHTVGIVLAIIRCIDQLDVRL